MKTPRTFSDPEFIRNFEKCKRVIRSCRTHEHIESAKNYCYSFVYNWAKKRFMSEFASKGYCHYGYQVGRYLDFIRHELNSVFNEHDESLLTTMPLYGRM